MHAVVVEERLHLNPYSATASFRFSALEEPFIACLSKTQATMSLHTGSSHSVRGCCLGLRPALLPTTLSIKNDEHPHPQYPCSRVREMKIRGVRRLVEERTARQFDPSSSVSNDQLTSGRYKAAISDPDFLRRIRLREGFFKSVVA